MTESKFLKRTDVGGGRLVTIESCEQKNVAKDSDPKEMKWCLHFAELDKPMVLNKVNAELISMISGERNSDNWGGIRVVLYDDPSVSYGGKLVGGIRVRAPRGQAAQRAPVAKPPVSDLDGEGGPEDGIPF